MFVSIFNCAGMMRIFLLLLLLTACGSSPRGNSAAVAPTPAPAASPPPTVALTAVSVPTALTATHATATPAPTQTVATAPPEEPGTITGNLGYPSEGVPAMRVYAIMIDDPNTFYSVRTESGQMTFTIPGVTPGDYHVVAYLADPPEAQFAGGYTEFVRCGLSVECSDHSLIPVTVRVGETAGGVEVRDWYAPPEAFPPRPDAPAAEG